MTNPLASSSTNIQPGLTSKVFHSLWERGHDQSEDVILHNDGSKESTFKDFALRLFDDASGEKSSGLDWIGDFLVTVQNLTGAERVFFFDVTGTPSYPDDIIENGNTVELGQCLACFDFDREPISKPETKISLSVVNDSVRTRVPFCALDTVDDSSQLELDPDLSSRVRGLLVIPLVVRNECHGVVYLDHRFQPIHLTEDVGGRLLMILHSASVRYALEKLCNQNKSLWSDLLAQRERLNEVERSSTHLPSTKSRPRHRAKNRTFEGNYDLIIGSSPAMDGVFELLDRIQTSNAPVLINGESGTGKELIANAVHLNSPRSSKGFVSENCGALTETLLESELFGYVKGAFTGATRDHKGLFELADRGTLFLDEVGDMSPAMQKKLLRAIQEGVIRPVGGKDYIQVDVRIISATNKDLLQEVRIGNFREDLYYRLNVINVKLPPLRERREDIPDLVQFFLSQLAKEANTEKHVSEPTMQLLTKYSWPGNIRELQNEVKRVFALADAQIEISQLSEAIRHGEGSNVLSSGLEDELRCMSLKEALEKVEKALIKRALLTSQGNKSQVAKQLQIPKTSLYNKISKYQLDQEVEAALYP